MVKVIVGILVTILVLVVGGGFVGYNMFVKPAVSFVGDAARFASEFQSYDERIRNVRPYSPPAGTELGQDQLQRFLAAQGDMRVSLEGRFYELENKYQELERSMAGREPNFRELLGAYRDFADLLFLAKRSQVDALNRHDFSLEEYAWVRQQTYMALGQQVGVAGLEQGDTPHAVGHASDRLLTMVEPHREQLMESYALAWFGL